MPRAGGRVRGTHNNHNCRKLPMIRSVREALQLCRVAKSGLTRCGRGLNGQDDIASSQQQKHRLTRVPGTSPAINSAEHQLEPNSRAAKHPNTQTENQRLLMDNTEEFKNYWETNMFLQSEEFDSWGGLDEAFSGYYDSSSPDGAASSAASKNIVSERNRRKKLNERLFALRAVVPNISKMDKASIIKDAIDYIQDLHEQERRIQAEISELESGKSKKSPPGYEFEQEIPVLVSKSKKKRTQHCYDSGGSRVSPIEVLELRVVYMGEKTVVVSLTCSKRTDTMVKLCEVFESLKLKIITANITAFSGRLLKTVFVEADEEEKDVLKIKIETAIAALNDPQSPMSI